MDAKAKIAYKNKIYQLKNTKLKRVFTENEIGNIYRERNKVFQMTKKLHEIVEKLKPLKDQLEKWRIFSHILKISLSLAEEGKKHKKWERTHAQKSGLDTVKLYQKEFKTIKKNMNEILELMEPVKALAPKGVSDFLNLYFKAFQNADNSCQTVCEYANRILEEATQMEKSVWENLNNPNSKKMLELEVKIRETRQEKRPGSRRKAW